MAEEEKLMTIPLLTTKASPRSKKASKAIKEIRDHVAKHMKAKPEDIWIDQELNQKIWERGIKKPVPRIRIKAIKFEDGLVEVSLPQE